MNFLNEQQIAIGKKVISIYWISVVVVAALFLDSKFGQKYVFFGVLIMFIHVIETFLFDKVLKEHSSNVIKDKFLMLPFGFLIPAGLKLNAENASKDIQDSNS